MTVLFFPILFAIHIFERYIDTPSNHYMRAFFPEEDDGSEDDPSVQDPEPVEGEREGMRISREKFEDIVKAFPDPLAVRSSLSSSGF